MQENYLISIIGKQTVDGETGEITLTTLGSYQIHGPDRLISYTEYADDAPHTKTTSTLKIEGNQKVTLTRGGGQNSEMVLEKGQRHYCHYDTGFGSMMVGIFANSIESRLGKDGGTLDIRYSLDINSGLTSINEIHIDVKEAERSHVNTRYQSN